MPGPAGARRGPGASGAPGRRVHSTSARPAAGAPGRLAPVYDIEGPRVRLGVGWFVVITCAVAIHALTAALAYGAVAALAARQIARSWRAAAWQADLATGLAVLPVVAALVGPLAVGLSVVLVVVAAGIAAGAPDAGLFPGAGGRVAAAGVVATTVVPGVAAASVVLVRGESVAAALVLVLLVSAYEAGDFIVGSGGSSPVEGPLAGVTAALLLGFPLTLVLVSPFDQAGMVVLALLAVTCPLGQVTGSALLPGAGADAPALRRIDTLLVLGLVWAAASGAL